MKLGFIGVSYSQGKGSAPLGANYYKQPKRGQAFQTLSRLLFLTSFFFQKVTPNDDFFSFGSICFHYHYYLIFGGAGEKKKEITCFKM